MSHTDPTQDPSNSRIDHQAGLLGVIALPEAFGRFMQELEIPRFRLTERLTQLGLRNDPTILHAIRIAHKVHLHQLRDNGSTVLRGHIYPVAALVIDYQLARGKAVRPQLVAAAILHDAVEDFKGSPAELKKLHDDIKTHCGEEVYAMVIALSRPDLKGFKGRSEQEKKRNATAAMISSINDGPEEVKLIKLVDIFINYCSIHLYKNDAKRIKMVAKFDQFYSHFCQTNSATLFDELDHICRRIVSGDGAKEA